MVVILLLSKDGTTRIRTPEQVELQYVLAGIGSRCIAQLIDMSILVGFFTLLGLSLYLWDWLHWLGQAKSYAIATGIVVCFFVFWGYFIVLEYFLSGQTIGKLAAHIRVIRDNGRPINFYASVIRNILRLIDFLPSGYLVAIITAIVTNREQRIGDLAAGTIVVVDKPLVSLGLDKLADDDVATSTAGEYVAVHRKTGVTLIVPANLASEWQESIQTFAKRQKGMSKLVRLQIARKLLSDLSMRPGVQVTTQSGESSDNSALERCDLIDGTVATQILFTIAKSLQKQARRKTS